MKKPILQKELLQLVSPLMELYGARFRKKTLVEAKSATGGEQVVTITKEGKETENTAGAGDFIVRNRSSAKETYVVKEGAFRQKYREVEPLPGGYSLYRAVGYVHALELTEAILEELQLESPFYFMADWGASMIAKQGDYLVMPEDQREVYRIARHEFWETYEPVGE